MLEFFRWVAALVIVVTSIALLLGRDWRWSLGILAAQYLAVFFLFLSNWPLTMAAAKLVTGWMAAAILGMTLTNQPAELPDQSSRVFKLFLAAVVAGAAIQMLLLINSWMSEAGSPLLLASLMLIGQGLLQLGMTTNPFRVTLGLLTTLLGFDLLSSPLDNSILVAALLTAVSLGLALTGSYLLSLRLKTETE
jgi:uncharacterized membrane protein